MALLLSNEEAIKAQVLFWLDGEGERHWHDGECAVPITIYVQRHARAFQLATLAHSLEAIAATANAALRMIDEMREPPMDLDETAGMK